METTNEFAAQVAAQEQMEKHNEEIKQTRVGGLGGSDAKMVYKIGCNGLGALSATEHKRLCIMLGMSEQTDWGGNAATNAGHLFEDYAEQRLPLGGVYEREHYMTAPLARNFKVFAHADFAARENLLHVIECKFVQESTQSVISKYQYQLQWYYMLGANEVMLYHGTGKAEPFEVEEATATKIERDQQTIDILLAGLHTLDEAIAAGWKPEEQEKIHISDTPDVVQTAYEVLLGTTERIEQLTVEQNEAKRVLKQYMEEWGFAGINGGGKRTIQYVSPKVTKSFNSQLLLKQHPEFNTPEYFSSKKVAGYIMMKK